MSAARLRVVGEAVTPAELREVRLLCRQARLSALTARGYLQRRQSKMGRAFIRDTEVDLEILQARLLELEQRVWGED